MAEEAQHTEESGPLPRTREAVDWWLRKWGRDAVVAGTEPLNREDVERLIQANGGTAGGLDLSQRAIELKLRRIQIDPQYQALTFNLKGANLREANLQDAGLWLVNFWGTNLWGANLQRAELVGANLHGSDLSVANLHHAKLYSAHLQHAKLEVTMLEGADLSNANLGGAYLRLTNLMGANLFRADLREARLVHIRISADTNLDEVVWDKGHVSILERNGEYGPAIALYRQLKEWYDRAGMPAIAGEFHYREREAARKRHWQRMGNEFKEFKRSLETAWQKFRGKEGSAS